MGAHAQSELAEVPFYGAIERIEQIRGELGEIKVRARDDAEMREQYEALCNDLRSAYADLAARAARKVADWRSNEEKLLG